ADVRARDIVERRVVVASLAAVHAPFDGPVGPRRRVEWRRSVACRGERLPGNHETRAGISHDARERHEHGNQRQKRYESQPADGQATWREDVHTGPRERVADDPAGTRSMMALVTTCLDTSERRATHPR